MPLVKKPINMELNSPLKRKYSFHKFIGFQVNCLKKKSRATAQLPLAPFLLGKRTFLQCANPSLFTVIVQQGNTACKVRMVRRFVFDKAVCDQLAHAFVVGRIGTDGRMFHEFPP